MENKISYLSILGKLLGEEIENYNKERKEERNLEANISMLSETITLLESDDYEKMIESFLLFDTYIPIFLNSPKEASESILNDLYSAIYTCKCAKEPDKYITQNLEEKKKFIKNLLNMLNRKLQDLNEKHFLLTSKVKPNALEETIRQYKKIKDKLNPNLKREINEDDYKLLLDLFKRKNLDERTIILLLEAIKNHNIKCHIKENQLNQEKLNAVTDILLLGFEELEDISWIDDERKSQLDSLIDTIISQNFDEDITPHMLPKYNGNLLFSENYSLSNVKYIYISLLKHYQNEVLEIHKEISKLDNYTNKEYRDFLVEYYKKVIKTYMYIRRMMDEEINKYNEDIRQIESQDEDKNKLYYGAKEQGKTYLESDLKNISKDAYSSIRDLLTLFRKGKLSPKQTKQLKNNHFKNNVLIQEIKDDQIRIIYTNLQGNEYVVLGVFIKKDDNLIKQYNTCGNRIPIFLVDSETVERNVFEALDYRTGGRRNAK